MHGRRWAVIKNQFQDILTARTQVDLKDKWRNLTRDGTRGKKKKRSCPICGTTRTPQWRKGGTLCNACGVAQMEGRSSKRKAAKKDCFKTRRCKSCSLCGTTRTPQWRKGGTLCNACGVAQMERRSSKRKAAKKDSFNIRRWSMQLEQDCSNFAAASTCVRPRRRKQKMPLCSVQNIS